MKSHLRWWVGCVGLSINKDSMYGCLSTAAICFSRLIYSSDLISLTKEAKNSFIYDVLVPISAKTNLNHGL